MSKDTARLHIFVFIFCAILLPPLTIHDSMPVIRAEAIYSFYLILVGRARMVLDDYAVRLLKILFLITAISIFISHFYFGVTVLFKDFMMFFMLLQYWIIYSFVVSEVRGEYKAFAVRMIAIIVSFSAIIGIMQKYSVLGVNSWLTPLYVNRESAVDALMYKLDYGRITGTIGDARHYAYILTLGIAASLSALLDQKSKIENKWLYAIAIIVSLSALPLTASRTGLIILIMISLVGIYHIRKISGLLIKITVVAMFVMPFLTYAYYEYVLPEAVRERLFDTDSESFEYSQAARQRDNIEPFKKAINDPIIMITGVGPQKAVYPGSEHSDIGWMTLHYGLPGLICYLSLLYGAYRLIVQYGKKVGMDNIYIMYCLLMIVAWFVLMLAESVFKNVQLMSVNLLSIGIIYAISPEKRTLLTIKYRL